MRKRFETDIHDFNPTDLQLVYQFRMRMDRLKRILQTNFYDFQYGIEVSSSSPEFANQFACATNFAADISES